MSDIQSFLRTFKLLKCRRCGTFIWKHFDVSSVCEKCTKELYLLPDGSVSNFYTDLTDATDEEFLSELKKRIGGERE